MTNQDDKTRALREAFPALVPKIERIENIRREVASSPLKTFFEPISVIDASKGTRKLESLDASTLTSWTRHICYQTRVRMAALEPSVLSDLADGRLLPTMVLLRSHVEAAGLACLAERTLSKSAHDGDLEPLQVLISKTLFGTALHRTAKKDEELQDLINQSAQETITIAAAIDALEQFVGPESTGVFRRNYAILCDFAHPNIRGVAGFSRVLEESDEGWTIQYSYAEKVEEPHVSMVLDLFYSSVGLGYCASEILRLCRFTQDDCGFEIYSPTEVEMRGIWERFPHFCS